MKSQKRIGVGIVYGVLLAVVLILWAGGMWLVSGGPGPEDDFPFSFPSIVTLYLVGGIAGGAIGGALAPLLRTRRGAYLVVRCRVHRSASWVRFLWF